MYKLRLRGRDWTIATGTILNDRTMNFSTSAAFFLSAETDDRERTVNSVYTRFCIPCRHDIYISGYSISNIVYIKKLRNGRNNLSTRF